MKDLLVFKIGKLFKKLYFIIAKKTYLETVFSHHLNTVAASVSKEDFILMDGTDISKKHVKYMETLKFVKNGDTGEIGPGYLLVKSNLSSAIEVVQWAFQGYGLRWKIEEYHRHIKQEYGLEKIQIKTFDGLQSMLATLTVAMHMIYKKLKSLHYGLLLDAGYNYLNKHNISELTNFIYYKRSKVVAILLMPTRMRWKILKSTPKDNTSQLNLMFN